MKTYKSKYSTRVTLVSALYISILLYFPLSFNFFLKTKAITLFGIIYLVVLIAWILFSFAQTLRKVTLDENRLTLHQVYQKISIPLSEIKEIDVPAVANYKIKFAPALFGHRIFLGKEVFTWVKDQNKMVLIKAQNQKYLFSCDNRDNLIESVRKSINS